MIRVGDLQKSIDEFQAWFTKNYNGKAKVRLGPAGDGMRLGVFATEKLPAESLYLSIPLKMVIGRETIFPTPKIGPVLQDLQGEIKGNVPWHQTTLALFLIYEKFIAQDKSFWKEYIALIPTEHDSPAFFTEEQLNLLKGTYIKEKAIHIRDQHRREYNWIRANILAKHKDVMPEHTFNFDHYMWAMGILSTRMIWWDNMPHLVPMLDMINCRQGPNPHRVHSTARGRSGLTADTLAPWTFQEGDQVFENYGQPNPTYFLYHGFVMIPNIHDCATLMLSKHIPGKAMSYIDKFRLQRQEWCVAPEKLNELLTIGRIAVMSDRERSALKQPPLKPLKSPRLEMKALRWCGDILKDQLAGYPEYDPMWRVGIESAGFREKMAVTFRETQRELFQKSLEGLRTQRQKILTKVKKAANPNLVKLKKQDASGKEGDL